jgi:hypothetical protein
MLFETYFCIVAIDTKQGESGRTRPQKNLCWCCVAELHNLWVHLCQIWHTRGDLSFKTRKFNTYFQQSTVWFLLGFIFYREFFSNVGPSTAEWVMYWVLYTNATVRWLCLQLGILYKYNPLIMNDSGTNSYIVARDSTVSAVIRLWALWPRNFFLFQSDRMSSGFHPVSCLVLTGALELYILSLTHLYGMQDSQCLYFTNSHAKIN